MSEAIPISGPQMVLLILFFLLCGFAAGTGYARGERRALLVQNEKLKKKVDGLVKEVDEADTLASDVVDLLRHLAQGKEEVGEAVRELDAHLVAHAGHKKPAAECPFCDQETKEAIR